MKLGGASMKRSIKLITLSRTNQKTETTHINNNDGEEQPTPEKYKEM